MRTFFKPLLRIVLPASMQAATAVHIYTSFSELTLEITLVILYELFSLTMAVIEYSEKHDLINLSAQTKRMLKILNAINLPFFAGINIFAYLHTHMQDPYKWCYVIIIGLITVMFDILMKIVIEIKRKK